MADKPASGKRIAPQSDPTTDEALLALAPSFADAPDIPVGVAQKEIASLARLAKASSKEMGKVGITPQKIDTLARYASRLKSLETAWQRARSGVKLTAAERKQLIEAEALDAKLLAGGRWGCRDDEDAQTELSRIAEGSGLTDTIQDLRDLVVFWEEHPEEIKSTDITAKDLARATELADALEPAAEREDKDVNAAAAQELRNRCFWSADKLSKEIREGGRYAFRLQPKIASKFISRYRNSVVRRSQRKAKAKKAAPPDTNVA